MNARLRCLVSFAAIALLLLASPALRAADGSVSFDGTGQNIFVPNFHNAGVSGEVTVEFWAKTNTDAIQQSAFMLFPDQGTNRFQAHISYFNGNTYWDCGDINAGGRAEVANPSGLVGNWTHYAFVSSASGGFMKIYVNGVEKVSKGAPVPGFNPAGNGATGYSLYIGGGSSFFLNGSLDEFRVWNVARTQWQVQTSLGADLTGSEAGLRLYYKFDEASGNSATNSATATGSSFNGGLFQGTTRSGPARLTVSNTNDSGTGSLHQAVTDAAAAAGASYITFAPALSGQTITLDSRISVDDDTGPVTIDASSLPGGLTLDGSGGAEAHAIFYVPSSTNLSLHRLTLTGGKNSAIISSGMLTLRRCTLFGNSSTSNGGAILSNADGNALLSNCTLFGNSAANGGAIYQVPPPSYASSVVLTLVHCTLSGNSASTAGGAIVSAGTFTPNGATIAYPLATLDNCIVAGNSAPSDPNLSGAFGASSNNLTSGDPLLSPLGHYGGSTMTMRPLPGSPAIDTGTVIAGLSTDQRGFARNVDGNGAGGAQPDRGAVEVDPVTVTTTVDENDTPSSGGAGISLREAVRSGQADVFFAPALSGQTIRLTEGTEIVLDKDVIIDASSLTAGLTVDGISSTGDNRVFTVSAGRSVIMTGLTLTGGTGAGTSQSGNGGAILNLGALSMTRCLIYGNQASDQGGAVQNQGTLSLKACSLVHNSAFNSGGGLYNTLSASLRQCTVAGNTCNGGGGGICNTGSFFAGVGVILTLEHCTIATNNAGEAGGIKNDASATIKIAQTVVAGNTAASTPEFLNNALVVPSGVSVVLGPFNSNLPGSGTVTNVFFIGFNPNITLGQLGYYGGGMPTMPPKPGSPIINGSVNSTITKDQRGFPIDGTPDIGAAERQAIETLTVTTANDEVDSLFKMETSLREAITDGAAEKIVFAPALSGGTITLTRSPAEIAITRGVSVDATSLPKGLTLDGGTGVNRIFNLTGTAPVKLTGLTLTGGEATGGRGGAILTAAGTDLTVYRCTLNGNSATEGGAIFSLGRLALERSTFNGNTGSYGGALQCRGNTTITHCTIAGNHAYAAGGIYNTGTTEANPLMISNSIVANNTSALADGEDIFNDAAQLVFEGINIVVDYHLVSSNVTSFNGASLFRGAEDAFLAPFGNYGGPTKTMPPLPGSRAVGEVVGSIDTTDQRGRPIVGNADLGACEGSNFIYHPLPAESAVISNPTPTLDWRWVGASGATFAVFIARTSGDLGDPITSGSTASIFTIPQSEYLGGHVYYWRVDTTVNGVTYPGQEFSFSNNVIDKGGRRDTGTTIDRAIATAAANPGADTILIGQNMNGQTLGVSGITVQDTGGVTIDATHLPNGAVLDGDGSNRLFTITAGSSLTLRGLTIRGGNGTGTDTSSLGGAFFNRGALTLERCTLSDNVAAYGGALFNESGASLILTQCTLAGNGSSPATLEAGAIYNRGTATLTHCTVGGNTAGNFGGLYNGLNESLTLVNCIVGGNSGGLGADMRNDGTLTHTGDNLVGSSTFIGSGGQVTGTGSITTAAPLLAPLGDYGGPTQTMALMPGSPARDAAISSTMNTDQRGFPLAGMADIGAYEAGAGEAGAAVNFNLWAWEIIGQALLPDGDNDNDGNTNLQEYSAKYDPFAADGQTVSPPSPNTAAPPPAVLSYGFSFRYNPEATDLRYIFQRSSDLSPTRWTDIYTYDSTTGLITETSGVTADEEPDCNLIYITDEAFDPARTFWRLVVEQP